MRFYVASSFQNTEQVREVANALTQKGFIHTYIGIPAHSATCPYCTTSSGLVSSCIFT